MAITAGTRIDRYAIERRIGAGGMAVVWQATHADLGTRHAVKVLSTTSPAVLDRLLAEGRIQARIAHPNVVRVTDVLRVDDQPALVMDYIDGPTLQGWLAERPRAWADVEPLIRGVLAGVAAAHAAGVVHRDLKPSNVLIDGAVAKVADFGIAKAAAHGGATRSGSALGTLRYMAPEQLRDASSVDARADVWALGCVLYECACGRPPYDGDDPIALYNACSAGQRLPIREAAPGLPEAVAVAIDAALEADRERRAPDVATLVRLLDGGAWAPARRDPTWDEQASPIPAESPAIPGFELGERVAIERGTERWAATHDGVRAEVTVAAASAGLDVRDRVRREARVLGELHHPRVAALLGSGTLADGRPWLARAVVGVPLTTWAARRRTRDEIHQLIADLLGVAAELHHLSPPVVVRDWSPERLAVGDHGVTIRDLGLVRDTPNDPAFGGATFDGSAGYMAPEQLRGDAAPATDVWGIAALAIGLLARRSPAALVEGAWRSAIDVPPDWAGALDAMLAVDPTGRPTARAALARWRELAEPEPTPIATPRGSPLVAEVVTSPGLRGGPRYAEPIRPDAPRVNEPLMARPDARFTAGAVAALGAGTTAVVLVLVGLFVMGIGIVIAWNPAPPYPDATPPVVPPVAVEAPVVPPTGVEARMVPGTAEYVIASLGNDRGIRGCAVGYAVGHGTSHDTAWLQIDATPGQAAQVGVVTTDAIADNGLLTQCVTRRWAELGGPDAPARGTIHELAPLALDERFPNGTPEGYRLEDDPGMRSCVSMLPELPADAKLVFDGRYEDGKFILGLKGSEGFATLLHSPVPSCLRDVVPIAKDGSHVRYDGPVSELLKPK